MMLGLAYMKGQTTLFYEDFNYPTGALPDHWVIDAEQPPSWSINESQIAGGVYPELYMTYGFQTGLSRLISPAINVEGHELLAIRYKQYMINYAGDWGEVIGMDVTFDDGNTWTPLWEQLLGTLNIPQDEFVHFIIPPSGTSELKVAFRFDGNNQGINGWAIDDLSVETVVEKDLLTRNLTGITTPNVGQEAVFFAEIENGGSENQSDYIVKLMSENGDELATEVGQILEFAQKTYVALIWIPNSDDLGEHKVYAKVELENDQNPENDNSKLLVVNVLPENTSNVHIGQGSVTSQHSVPYDFFYPNSLSQSLYLADDIGEVSESASIIGLQYTCFFDVDVDDVPIQIYMAETTQDNLGTDWLDPSNFTLVYDNNMSFKTGLNTHYIALDNAFEYNGGNLVIYSNKTHDEQVLWTTFITTFNQDVVYSRLTSGSSEPYDPMNPSTGYNSFSTPNVNLFFSSGELSIIDHSPAKNSITIYPNPASDVLTIQNDLNTIINKVQLVNSTGQIVLNKTINSFSTELDIKSIESGFYIIQIITEKGDLISKKILIK